MLKMKKTGRRSRSTRCRVTYERQSSKLVIHPTLISTPSFRKNRKLWKKKRLKMKKTNEPKRFVKKFFSEGVDDTELTKTRLRQRREAYFFMAALMFTISTLIAIVVCVSEPVSTRIVSRSDQDINGVIGTTGSKLYIPKSAVSNTLTIVA
ncbi:uncharacterized protein LOC111271736 [Varroa jacobsoni]|uniref:Uncharacterized protein n=1 Tax=Varroa destructor TaxID=109461 RepID=A0A7M7KQL2_VARDE|nr:uncharacterized protein LOC111254060 [Varroa destructor]XP_022708446.1 uncharacterized protein LOC111271736 [Varroa jacobsoni]